MFIVAGDFFLLKVRKTQLRKNYNEKKNIIF